VLVLLLCKFVLFLSVEESGANTLQSGGDDEVDQLKYTIDC
jgi:hypothetical protein